MSHDPLCGLSEPCDDEVPEHGYCLMSHGKFCIHCNQWCICGQIRQAEQRMLAAAMQRVEALDLHRHYRIECDPPSEGYVYAEHLSCNLVAKVTAAIKGDQG